MAVVASSFPSDDDLQLVEATLRDLRDYSNLAAAETLGISEATLRRWRAGNIAVPLRTSTRLALRAFLEERGTAGDSIWWQAPVSSGSPGPQDGEAMTQVFASLARIREFIAGIAPPGKAEARKMDVLNGIRQVITARFAVPDWWYELQDEVRRGRL